MKKLIREEEVKAAAKGQKILFVDSQTVVTPSAKDMAKQLGVTFTDQAEKLKIPAAGGMLNKWPFHKVAIASDHGGFYLKEEVKELLRKEGFMVFDLGPGSAAACDYPDYAIKTAEQIATEKVDCGIMIDSVGIGSAMAANRVQGVLAAKCNNVTEAKSAREHNYANMLTLGSKIVGTTAALDIVLAFLNTEGGAERHIKRIGKILDYEKKGK